MLARLIALLPAVVICTLTKKDSEKLPLTFTPGPLKFSSEALTMLISLVPAPPTISIPFVYLCVTPVLQLTLRLEIFPPPEDFMRIAEVGSLLIVWKPQLLIFQSPPSGIGIFLFFTPYRTGSKIMQLSMVHKTPACVSTQI